MQSVLSQKEDSRSENEGRNAVPLFQCRPFLLFVGVRGLSNQVHCRRVTLESRRYYKATPVSRPSSIAHRPNKAVPRPPLPKQRLRPLMLLPPASFLPRLSASCTQATTTQPPGPTRTDGSPSQALGRSLAGSWLQDQRRSPKMRRASRWRESPGPDPGRVGGRTRRRERRSPTPDPAAPPHLTARVWAAGRGGGSVASSSSASLTPSPSLAKCKAAAWPSR